jgi:aldehyde:ferredoxin oxidoreductase
MPGCLVKCSNIVNDENGNYLTAGFEYETIELFGPNCKIYDLDVIAKIDRFCDDFGFDTIELAVTLGVYFDSGKMNWSEGAKALAMFESFYAGGELADDFGMGALRLGEKYGVKRIPAVKGQAIAAYEPRNLKGTGMVYALSTMGADHTCGNSITRPEMKGTEKEGVLDFAVGIQNAMAACDSNMCLFSFAATIAEIHEYANAINAAYGYEWTAANVMGMGGKAIATEREFNRRAGFTPAQDALPEFFYKDPAPATGAVFDITAEEVAEKWHV